MQSQIEYINQEIENDNIELKKAELIKQEISEQVKYNLYDDGLILL